MLIVLQHHPRESPARLGQILTEHGHRLRTVELFDGAPLPPDLDDVDGLVVMGGPMNVDETDQHAWLKPEMDLIKQAHDAELPIVGICLGSQLIAAALGGEVAPMDTPEAGFAPVKLAFPGTMDPLHAGIPWESPQFHLHGQQVVKLPDGATPLSGSEACKTQAFKVGLRTYGFQYHFEWTRRDLDVVLDDNTAWLAEHGIDAGPIRESIDAHFPQYRRLGDRLAATIANILYPIDKRISHTIRPAANFHAS